jgi:hypothetical protein
MARPVMLARELFRRLEDALDRRRLMIGSPDGVDSEHRTGRRQVDQLDAAGELLDQGADDEPEAAPVGDVAQTVDPAPCRSTFGSKPAVRQAATIAS